MIHRLLGLNLRLLWAVELRFMICQLRLLDDNLRLLGEAVARLIWIAATILSDNLRADILSLFAT